MLQKWLKDIVIRIFTGEGMPELVGGIRILEEGESLLDSHCLYIGDHELIEKAFSLERFPGSPIMIISAGSCKAFTEDNVPRQLRLVETSLPVIPLYNRVQESVHRYLEWDKLVRDSFFEDDGLKKILDASLPMFNATLLLCSSWYKTLAASCHPDVNDIYSKEIQDLGHFSYESIQKLSGRETENGSLLVHTELLPPDSENHMIIRRICFKGEIYARLFVVLKDRTPDPYVSDLTEVLGNYLSEFMYGHHGVDFGGNPELRTFISDLIEFRLTDKKELDERVSVLKLSITKYYHLIVISVPEDPVIKGVPYNYLINQIKQIFPYSDISTYMGDILVLVPKKSYEAAIIFDREALETLLDKHDAHAAISNYSRFLTSLPTIYHQTKLTLRLGMKMSPDERIYIYEDYSMYHIIEMADKGSQAFTFNRNIIYLCHPGLIALMNHDRKTGGNLTEVMHIYLRNERNSALAAKKLFIHRNTMLNKVHRIEEILGETLDDPRLRERLLFSYHVIEYTTKYRNEDVMALRKHIL